MKNKYLAWLAFCLAVCQVLTILLSWFISATMPQLAFRSLLGSEGIRWFFGQFAHNLSSPVLVWLVLCGMALGLFRISGLQKAIFVRSKKEYRERFAIKVVICILVFFLLVMGLLTLTPHAVLLNVTGDLYPSSFSQSLIPVICFFVCCVSVVFGLISISFHSLSEIFNALSAGIKSVAALLVVYVIAVQLFYSVLFVLAIRSSFS